MPIVVLDTETTGLDPAEDKLVELAGIRLAQNQADDIQFSTLCNPGRSISHSAMGIHHITEDQVQHLTITPEIALDQMVTALSLRGDQPNYFVAHNAKFDRGMMASLLDGFVPVTWICTYRCALMLWPDAPDHKNQTLRYYLGLKPILPPDLAPHRALYDIICTAEIFRAMLVLAPFEQLVSWSNNPILLPRATFGKHRGKPWSEVDFGYLRWCMNNMQDDEDIQHTVQYWMRKR